MASDKSAPSADSRVGRPTARSSEVLRSAVDLFAGAPAHERVEIRAFADLMTGLLPDAAAEDRAHAAERLAARADTPPVVARLLAMDAPDIARPMVERSPVLTSSDLVQILRCGPAHVAMVADRLDLAVDVVIALGRSMDFAPAAASVLPAAGPAGPAVDDLRLDAVVETALRARPVGNADSEAEVALQRALDELAAELAAEVAPREAAGAATTAEAEAETALAAALDRLAAEFETEARAHDAEAAAVRALRAAGPEVPADVEVFLGRDSAGRWRFIQDYGTSAATTPPPRRRRSDDPAVIGTRLFGLVVGGDGDRLAAELARATGLDRAVVDRVLTDRGGEALAVTLAALGIDERTATSILLLHAGERAEYTHMQDLAAMAGRIGWRTAEHILASWRGDRGSGRGETARVLDGAERRETGLRGVAGGETSRGIAEPARRSGSEG